MKKLEDSFADVVKPIWDPTGFVDSNRLLFLFSLLCFVNLLQM